MNISLIFPSRDRLEFFKGLMASLEQATLEPAKVEILIAIDDDDLAMLKAKDELEERYKAFSLKFYVTKQSEHFTKDYINFLARKAKGRWIIPINDDSEFRTKKWDKIVNDKMSHKADCKGDDFLLGLIKDGIPRQGEDLLYPHFSCWPVMSRDAVDTFGYLFHEDFIVWGVDHFVADVYRACGRLVSLVEVFIDHNSPHLSRRPKDDNYRKFQAIEKKYGFSATPQFISSEIKKLSDHIEKRQHEKTMAKNSLPV